MMMKLSLQELGDVRNNSLHQRVSFLAVVVSVGRDQGADEELQAAVAHGLQAVAARAVCAGASAGAGAGLRSQHRGANVPVESYLKAFAYTGVAET